MRYALPLILLLAACSTGTTEKVTVKATETREQVYQTIAKGADRVCESRFLGKRLAARVLDQINERTESATVTVECE